jgi:hypothetical protein
MPIARIGGHELVFGLGFVKPGRDLVDRALQRALQQFGFDRTLNAAWPGVVLTFPAQRKISIAKERERI